jgi:hypothetical protein
MRAALSLLIVLLASASASAATSASRNGITWTWSEDRQIGTYANGDPWVVGPITITSITPAPTAGLNGTVVNPALGSTQGYFSGFPYNPYSEALNVGNNLPLVVAVNSSVVSTISNAANDWGKIEDMGILTVVAEAPAEGSFRPGYIGTGSRASAFTISDMSYARLNNLPRAVLSGVPSLATLQDRFDEPWYAQDLTWTGRYLNLPYMGIAGYGRDVANQLNEACIALNLDFTNAQKETLLIQIVQIGLDYGHIIAQGGAWNNDGAHNVGRLSPVLLAAMVLDDPTLKEYCAASANKFSEFQQTFYVDATDVATAHTPVNSQPVTNYVAADIGKPEWGIIHNSSRLKDNDRWDAPYRDSSGSTMPGAAAVVIALGAQDIVGASDAFLAYAQRHIYYRQSRYTQSAYYNSYDDAVSYGAILDGAGASTANAKATPFSYNDVPTFASSFYLTYEFAGSPGAGEDTTSPVVSGVSVSDITTTTARISAAADEGVSWLVELGETLSYELTPVAQSGASATLAQTVSGLTAETTHYFRITATDGSGNSSTPITGTFITAAAGLDPADDPTFSPDGGSSLGPITLAISKTNGGVLMYSVGDSPGADYSSPLLITESGNVSAWVAAGGGYARSTTVTRTFTIGEMVLSEQLVSYSFSPMSGNFAAVIRVRRGTAGSDIVLGLIAVDAPSGVLDIVTPVRFYTNGLVQAKNGAGAYSAENPLNWAEASADLFDVAISGSVVTDTFSVTVTPFGGSPVVIASNYAFRTTVEQVVRFGAINDVTPFDGLITSFSIVEPGVARTAASPIGIHTAP